MALFRDFPGLESQMTDIKAGFSVVQAFREGNPNWHTLLDLDRLVRTLAEEHSPALFATAVRMCQPTASADSAATAACVIQLLINCLGQIFSHQDTASHVRLPLNAVRSLLSLLAVMSVSAHGVQLLIPALLSKLADSSTLGNMSDAARPKLMHSLGGLVEHVLRFGRTNDVYRALFHANLTIPIELRARGQSCVLRYQDLVIKCLEKLVSHLEAFIAAEGLSVEGLLLDMADYVEAAQIERISHWTPTENAALCMVKTTPREMCRIVGVAILQCCHRLRAVPILIADIHLNLEIFTEPGSPTRAPTSALLQLAAQLQDENAATLHNTAEAATPKAIRTNAATCSFGLVHNAAPLNDENAPIAGEQSGKPKRVLDAILETMRVPVPERLKTCILNTFNELVIESTSKAALHQLCSLLEMYPDLPVDRFIAKTTAAFKDYVHTGIDKIQLRRDRVNTWLEADMAGSPP